MQKNMAFATIAILVIALFSATLATVRSAHADGAPVCSPKNPHVCTSSDGHAATNNGQASSGTFGPPIAGTSKGGSADTNARDTCLNPNVFKNGQLTCAS